jgi:hypothetical protein
MDELERDLQEIASKAKSIPGLEDLLRAYGDYEIVLERVNSYFEAQRPQQILSTADHS